MSRPPAREGRVVDGLAAAGLGAAAFILYARALAPTVLAGDPGEFQFAAWLGGISHPTGYPLYTLLGWAWSHLVPLGDAAWRMNLFSAIWGALAVALLYPTAGALVRRAVPDVSPAARRLAAAVATATFAVTPTFWSQAVIAEVYTLHILLVVALVNRLLAWRDSPDPGSQRRALLVAAGCFGLGLAHHRTIVVLLPAVAACLWLARRPLPAPSRWARQAPALALAVCLPLLLYLYIPWRAPHTPYLRLPVVPGQDLVLYDNTLKGLIDFVLGGPFGGSIDLSLNLAERLAMAGRLLWAEVPWPGLVLALVGIGRLAARRDWALLALTGLACAGTVAFNLVYDIGDIYVLFIPSYLVVALWLAAGLGAMAVGAQRVARSRAWPAAALVPFLALPVWMAAGHYAGVDRSGESGARSGWEAILAEPVPNGAVLVSNDRNDIMPMWYLQYVEGRRPDLIGLFPLITPSYPTLGTVLGLTRITENPGGRPVYLIKDMPGLEIKVKTEAEGRLWRVDGPAAAGGPRYPTEVTLAGAVRLRGYDLAPGEARPGEAVRAGLYWAALEPLPAVYHSFVHVIDEAGQSVVQSDHQPGGVFYPSTLWQVGETLFDEHTLTIPAGTAPGTYGLLVGLYELSPDGAIRPLGDPVVAGRLTIKAGTATGSRP